MMERDPSPGAPLRAGAAWPAGGCNACGPDAPSVSSGEEVTLLVREGERCALCFSTSSLTWAHTRVTGWCSNVAELVGCTA